MTVMLRVGSRVVFTLSFILATMLIVGGIIAPLFGGLWYMWGALALTVGISGCVTILAVNKSYYFSYTHREHRGLRGFILLIAAFLGCFLFAFISGTLAILFLSLLVGSAYLAGRPFDVTPTPLTHWQ